MVRSRRRTKSSQQVISDFTVHFYKLKELPRTGWKQKLEIENAESVAAHTFLMIVLVLFFSEKYRYSNKQKVRLIEMALIHDLAESIIGDITPQDDKEYLKRKLEDKAFHMLTEKMPSKNLRKKIFAIMASISNKQNFRIKVRTSYRQTRNGCTSKILFR